MGRETAEGPAAVEATLAALRRSPAVDLVASAARVVLVGTGASLAVVETAEAAFRGRGVAREASAIALGALDGEAVRAGDVGVVVSMSGRSPETRAAARALAAAGAVVVAVTADPDSPLAAAANVVVVTPIGPETGAATKSELAAYAAVAALAGAIAAGPATDLRSRLEATVADVGRARALGQTVANARHRWALGFGPALGLARATALLLHEKARRATVFCSPSEFRHGPIEAATPDDVVVVIDAGLPSDERRAAYLARLGSELGELGVPLVRVGAGTHAELPLPADATRAESVLHAFLRAQQLARVSALAAGTYGEEFRVLRRVVRAADDLV
jgi:glutamine---fructose-6-phosphate transaminase (isomerizing)